VHSVTLLAIIGQRECARSEARSKFLRRFDDIKVTRIGGNPLIYTFNCLQVRHSVGRSEKQYVRLKFPLAFDPVRSRAFSCYLYISFLDIKDISSLISPGKCMNVVYSLSRATTRPRDRVKVGFDWYAEAARACNGQPSCCYLWYLLFFAIPYLRCIPRRYSSFPQLGLREQDVPSRVIKRSTNVWAIDGVFLYYRVLF